MRGGQTFLRSSALGAAPSPRHQMACRIRVVVEMSINSARALPMKEKGGARGNPHMRHSAEADLQNQHGNFVAASTGLDRREPRPCGTPHKVPGWFAPP